MARVVKKAGEDPREAKEHRRIHGSLVPYYVGQMARSENRLRVGAMNRGETGKLWGIPGRTGRGPQR